MSLDRLARRQGLTVRRGRTDPARVWLVDPTGRLLTAASGTDEATARELLSERDAATR